MITNDGIMRIIPLLTHGAVGIQCNSIALVGHLAQYGIHQIHLTHFTVCRYYL
jgi:hypothetical protein